MLIGPMSICIPLVGALYQTGKLQRHYAVASNASKLTAALRAGHALGGEDRAIASYETGYKGAPARGARTGAGAESGVRAPLAGALAGALASK
ncbi:hypothetical protein A9Q02_12790 [Candidatus Chloroploca asiatica]|uniref:Uncharacterized protein n=1 Tax=Candidatus Chloroploca asiatica TaxID=1506545 RepID=A0A2H3KMC8_9CHLR|nr:hypothetical protein A9Q02_12790 [Candidatus Chloroploca asiatica]